jgi:formyl-CoA transferase
MPRSKPFDGITVVELGSSLAGPYAARILADMGAQVIKVEHPKGGDVSRQWGPTLPDGGSAAYHAVNMGKQSIVADLTDADDLARLRALIVDRADVVLQNLKPGAADRYGLGAQALHQAVPRLIYCNIGAFGNTGPLGGLPGYDPLMQAFSGITSLTGEQDRPPSRVGVSLIDLGTGMWAAIAIVSALFRRTVTGEGAVVDVSLLETGIGWLTLALGEYGATGAAPRRNGLKGPIVAPNNGFETADGTLVIVAATDAQFARLCAVLGRAEMAGDPRFATNAARFANEVEMSRQISEVLRTDTRAVWAARLDKAGIPNAPVQSVAEIAAHPQTEALGILRQSDDNPIRFVGLPLSIDGVRPSAGGHAPDLGEHDQQVFEFMCNDTAKEKV